MLKHTYISIVVVLGICVHSTSCHFFAPDIDYNLHVKPILNKRCITCHGGIKKSNGFSLLSRETAFQNTDSGEPAIVAGQPDSSEFIRRLHMHDPDERMPLEGDPLPQEEIKILTQWVEQGAEWGLHWAYQPIQPFTEYSQANTTERTNHLIQRQLDIHDLNPNSEAEKPELLRRVSLAIIGMPAPIEIQQQYLNSENPISYLELVEALMALPSYGEKWASVWLDIARYADSKGFERDENRSIWPYRDFVIRSLNDDKPYNTFVLEQIAGDLLPDPNDEQLIATGFHRNTTTNDEGGTDNEAYRNMAVIDRVNTTWEGLMSTTMACVQCHGHPYDPIPHKAYYQSFAFLNNTRDYDTYADYPRLQLLDTLNQAKLDSLVEWIRKVDNSSKGEEIQSFVKTVQPVIYSIETDQMDNADHYDTKFLGLRKNGSARIPNVQLSDKSRIVMRARTMADHGKVYFLLDSLSGPVIGSLSLKNSNWAYGLLEVPLISTSGIHDIYIRYTNGGMRSKDQLGIQVDWFYFTDDFPGREKAEYRINQERFESLIMDSHQSSLIMIENKGDRIRKTHVFDRGNWMTPMEEVQGDVPEVLPKLKSENNDRLAFAEWIVDPQNPLTARAFVNRVWEQLFGKGIVASVDDFGSQGDLPTHPELLDDLAYRWMHEQNWSIKSLIKTIVLTDAYQRSAKSSARSERLDPNNLLLSRGPRNRLSAEQVRDQALYISGLLSKKMYGEPVMPFQPEGVWNTPYNSQQWKTSEGEDAYRRAIYTMMKRSSIYPSMTTFDMSQRLVCEAKRINTNTPLQALVTLNDPVFYEAAKHLAVRMREEGGNSVSQQIDFAYQLAMSQPIKDEKLTILEELYQETLDNEKTEYYESEEEKIEFAMTIVANALLNLDEILNN